MWSCPVQVSVVPYFCVPSCFLIVFCVSYLKVEMKANDHARKLKAKKFKKTVNSVFQKDFEFENAEISASEDEGDETRQHQKLLEAVQKLKGQKPTVIQRSEASQKISEFNLTEVGKEKVKLNELVKTLKQTTSHVSIKQQLRKVSHKKKLPVPLSKPVAEQIQRTVAYSKVSEEVTKWDGVVKSNRSAEQIIYPLKQPEYRLETTKNFVKRFTTKTPLEEGVAKFLSGSEYAIDQEKTLTPAEEKGLRAMGVKEAAERHKELQKIRALLSYKEAKARRQSKIKSKKFHRVLKKEKMKKLIKEFDDLQNNDPDAAQEKLKMLDKQRIMERVTLKHKSTGKWAKYQKLRAKYNLESRESLKEQLELGRELSKKVILPDKVDDGSNTAVPTKEEQQNMCDDHLLNLYVSENVGLKSEALKQIVCKDTETESKTDTTSETVPTACSKQDVEEVVSDSEDEELIDESLERKKTVEDFEDVLMDEKLPKRKTLGKDGKEKLGKDFMTENPPKIKKSEKPKNTDDFDWICVAPNKKLDSIVPEGVTFLDEDLDAQDVDDSESVMSIGEAFADDTVIGEFKEDKNAVRKRQQPEGIDLFLPGWGSWGGSGIRPSKWKKQRFFIKAPIVNRKDDTLGNVIINEDKDKKAATHQVSQLPFPFNSIHQFQSIIRQPVGNTWNPETSFKNMISPKVVTKSGKIIDPIDAEALVLQKTMDQKPSELLKGKPVKLSKKQGNNKNKRGQKNNNLKSKLRNKHNKK